MDKATRNAIERATQQARKLIEEDFSLQLEGTFDVLPSRAIAPNGGAHLSAHQQFQRDKIVAAIEHKRAAGMTAAEAVTDYVRDSAFTTLNRFVALKMLEARELVQECITKGEHSAGYREFCGMAPGVALLPDAAGYRLYIESLFDEFSTEIKVLFDRRDAASVLWPKRQTFDSLLAILNANELSLVWGEDETIGWVYQFFNGGEERREMREKSQAPRNSRELAVRNQFFTPRYVVQFLTDNTLGHIWYEMRGAKTELAERCEFMVRTPQEDFAPRSKKDPRDLRVLDPACGSGHFLLYAFDLLLAIYEEAHTDPDSPKSDATGHTLAGDYPSLDVLRKAVPGLILAHNLHGVDIDPRCAQIAQFALWMRAQKAYRDFGIGRAERAQIRRSNIVVAEPLVADEQIAQEFVAKLDDAELGRVFTALVDSLNLAGDLGLLLRVETLVARQTKRGTTGDLFAPPEERIRAALARFVSDESGQVNTRRRLFVDDAAHGVALLGVAEKKFDVVLMNPPFGDGTPATREYFESHYPKSKCDILAMFVERGIDLLHPHGRLGAITSRTALFLESFTAWRQIITEEKASPVVLADLGYGVLDAMVEVAMYVLESQKEPGSLFAFRGTRYEHKAAALAKAIREQSLPAVDMRALASLPNRALAYWVPVSLLRVFASHGTFGAKLGLACKGISTADNFRFLRLAWEVPPEDRANGPESILQGAKWVLMPKGGEYSPFYDDIHLVVLWAKDGYEIRNFADKDGNVLSRPQNLDRFFRRGLTYPYRTTSGFNLRVLPYGCALSDGGQGVFLQDQLDHDDLLLCVLGYFYTRLARAALEISLGEGDATSSGSAARNYVTGAIESVPAFSLDEMARRDVATLVRACVGFQQRSFFHDETAREFIAPYLRNSAGIAVALKEERRHRADDWLALIGNVQRIEEIFNLAFALDAEAGSFLDDEFGTPIWSYTGAPSPEQVSALLSLDMEKLVEHAKATVGARRYVVKKAYIADRTLELIAHVTKASPSSIAEIMAARFTEQDKHEAAERVASWSVGVAFGRWDVDAPARMHAATSNDTFGVPIRALGLECDRSKVRDVLADDEGHPSDIVPHMKEPLELNWGRGAITEAEEILGGLRRWIREDFFIKHCAQYSKSRRKAPIYWQLATPSSSYSVWLHLHAFTKDTLYKVQNDWVSPKLAHEERKLDSLRRELGESPKAEGRKRLAAQERFVQELRSFLEEVRHVAPIWCPNLDDGVVINFAPLWRLVPHHKAWQKELKTTWDALCRGEYDWARLAMHLWPERVVQKCATDRSLAIAHGLEDTLWVEENAGKWKPRPIPTRAIDELVRERTSVSVKAALKSLLESPVSNANGGRGRGRRVASATSDGGAS
jgi:hypothetical protein